LAIISIIFISVLGTNYWQKNISTKTENKNNKNTISTPTLVPTPTVEIKDFSVIENIFKEVSDNTIKFNSKTNNINIYNSEDINLQEYFSELSSPTSLIINVYQYQPGAKFNSGYEGYTWVVNLDEWKQWLDGLVLGENKVYKLCNDWGCGGLEQPQTVTAKKINTGKYFIGNGSFKPAGNLNRNYTSFSSKNNTLIDVRIDYYTEMNSIEMLGIFSKIESLLP
jgi:hypothetical protein